MKERRVNHRIRSFFSCKRLVVYMMLLSLAPILFSCNPFKKKRLNKRVTLKRTDKIPYGTYVAYENLGHIFPSAVIEVNRISPSSYNWFPARHKYPLPDDDNEADTPRNGNMLYLVISPYFSPDAREYKSIMEFIGKGNHVFVCAQYWGEAFRDSMKISITQEIFGDSLSATILNPLNFDSLAFTYPGNPSAGYFTSFDTTYATVIARDTSKRVNLIKHTYQGGGSMYIHASPLTFTNFFLLHKENSAYYDNVFSYLPENVSRVEWDDYFRYGKQFSALQVIMNNPGLRAGFWVVLLIFLLIFLFDSKRKQRIIPTIQPLKNASVDFVKTIGRLYYQYRDNRNLGLKMIAHLMDHIRSRYNLPTSSRDDRFITALAHKSGYDLNSIKKMIYHAKMIEDSPKISDEELMEFHKLTEAFYKHQ
ncbi:MAG TPA: DUF4350 domain-containing protein [Chitinophagaceae bacterium]